MQQVKTFSELIPTALATGGAYIEPPRSYDEICEDSRIAVSDSDEAAWKIGDNAIKVVNLNIEKSVADYAIEIRKPKGTVYEFHSMSRYWSPQVRTELKEFCPNITRSHMRKVLSFKDSDQGRWLIEKCSERDWSVDRFGAVLKRYKRIKGIGRKPTPRHVSASPLGEFISSGFELDKCNDCDVPLLDKKRYRVVVYEAEEAKA